jgi:serine/threonine-protein kinase RsbW
MLGAFMDSHAIRLTAPCTLQHRALAVRLVAEVCRLARAAAGPTRDAAADPEGDLAPGYDVRDPFDVAVVSAFAEIYNNLALHACAGMADPVVELRALIDDDGLIIELTDHGRSFDPASIESPDLDALPEGGMGLHIARAMLDAVEYEPGPPNLWRLHKRLPAASEPAPASARIAQR